MMFLDLGSTPRVFGDQSWLCAQGTPPPPAVLHGPYVVPGIRARVGGMQGKRLGPPHTTSLARDCGALEEKVENKVRFHVRNFTWTLYKQKKKIG